MFSTVFGVCVIVHVVDRLSPVILFGGRFYSTLFKSTNFLCGDYKEP